MQSNTKYVKLTDENFQMEVLEAAELVLVSCWANWCTPHYIVDPGLGELAVDFAGQIKISQLNLEDSTQIAMRYNVRAVPTLLIFSRGEIVEQVVGGIFKVAIAAKLNILLQRRVAQRLL